MVQRPRSSNMPPGAGDSGARRIARFAPALLVLISLPLFFFGLGSVPLLDPDEPYYAVPALEMHHEGVWSVTVFQGEPWFDKPILFYWIVLAAFKLLGVSEFSARIGSALAALGGVLCVYRLALRMRFGVRGALISALALAAGIEYLILARAAVTDMTLTAAVTLGMTAAARYLETERIRWAGLAGAAFGLAILTKGPVGILIPGVALPAYCLLTGRRRGFRPAALAACGIGVLGTAGPWYAYMLAAHPDLLVGTFLVEGNLGRFLDPEHQPFPLFYLAVIGAGLLPWSGALPTAISHAVRPAARASERGPRRPPGVLFALCWFSAVIVIFTLSASKLASYVLPAFPAAALLIGSFWKEWFAGRGTERNAAGFASILGAALSAVMAAALVRALQWPPWNGAVGPGILLALVLFLGSIAAAVAVFRRRLVVFLCVQTAIAFAVAVALVVAVGPRIHEIRSAASFVDELRRNDLAGSVAGTFRVTEEYSLDYYLGRPVPRIDTPGVLLEQVENGPGALWIVHRETIDSLVALTGRPVECLVERSRYAAVRLATDKTPPIARGSQRWH